MNTTSPGTNGTNGTNGNGNGNGHSAPSAILHPPSSSAWMSVTEAAAALGYTPDTIRKHALKWKGVRIGRGPWRFPRAEIELAKVHPQILSHPRTTLQELHQKVNRVSLLSEERELCIEEKIKSFERKLKALEARLVQAAA